MDNMAYGKLIDRGKLNNPSFVSFQTKASGKSNTDCIKTRAGKLYDLPNFNLIMRVFIS